MKDAQVSILVNLHEILHDVIAHNVKTTGCYSVLVRPLLIFAPPHHFMGGPKFDFSFHCIIMIIESPVIFMQFLTHTIVMHLKSRSYFLCMHLRHGYPHANSSLLICHPLIFLLLTWQEHFVSWNIVFCVFFIWLLSPIIHFAFVRLAHFDSFLF